ncbi:hypothetical protein TEA_017529 [Camellia sinensis var. sinensis]|uniref:glucose-6-phosphate 1-epimerase n=1 Tax=Camellia sinensis var. sinensis TaxID=542762 RepID=A0A4S4DBP9_CAMSN|nr:hypothetical protein TEA_017529 [Camellia sinensis var. sinensis]
MSNSERVPVELCKGVNGLDKVVLREVRGSSAEVISLSLSLYIYTHTHTHMRHGFSLISVTTLSVWCLLSLSTVLPLPFLEIRGSCVNFPSRVEFRDKIDSRYCLYRGHLVYLYGGHVTSWKNDHGEELLFVSSKAIFKPPKAIRGGIPICFPQFSNHGSLEQHGFARNRFWSIDTDPPPFPTNSSSKAFVDLILKPSEEDLKIWPHSEVRVEGLETLDYLDNLKNKERFTEQGDAITFESEASPGNHLLVDKIYLSTPTKIAILDHEKKRTFVIRKDGLPDAVVWNPWDKKAKAMADFGDDEYKHMLCMETAAVEKAITLKPGEEWRGRQELSAVPSSYCSGQLDPQRVLQSS